MKKMILSAFCLGMCFTSVNALAVNTISKSSIVVSTNDERKALKPDELPEPVTKTLASDSYKGWSVKEAALVTTKAADKADAVASHYEVVLTNGTDTKTVKFQKDGTLLN